MARITNRELMEIGAYLLRGTVSHLHAVIADPEASVLQRWLAVLINQSFLHGDVSIFRVVLDRVVGRPPQSKYSEQCRPSINDAACYFGLSKRDLFSSPKKRDS